MEFWALLLLILVICISYLILIHRKWQEENSRFPPGPTPLPILGNLLQIKQNDVVNSLMKLHKKYGNMFTLYLGPQRYVVLCGYETMKAALIDNAEAFSGRGYYPLFENFTKGNDIAFSNGEKWKQMRQFAISALGHFGVGKRSIEKRIQEEVGHLIQYFRETKKHSMGAVIPGTTARKQKRRPSSVSPRQNPPSPQEALPVDTEFCMSRSLANIISSIVFGNRFEYGDKEFEDLVHSVQDIFQTMSTSWATLYHIFPDILDRLPGPQVQMFKDFGRLESFIRNRAKKNAETVDPNCPRDFIDSFLTKLEKEKHSTSSFFNWDTLSMCSLILFFAGIESGSTTIRFGFIHLMKNPKVQEKVQEEIDRVIGHHLSPSYEHRSQMPYTQAVIHEIQRIADVIPLALTHSLTEDINFKGYKFQKGTFFIPLMTSVHFDPLQYKEPDNFDPANFLDENGDFKLNPAFMPLSAGKRVCLGANLANMELFIYFTTILQNFTLKPEGRPEDIDACPIGVFLANIPRPFKLSFIPR